MCNGYECVTEILAISAAPETHFNSILKFMGGLVQCLRDRPLALVLSPL